jgi:short-subunit dehydrogenase
MKLIISGATRGIGKSIACKFASQGFQIAFCGRNENTVNSFETYLKENYGIKAYGFVADIAVKLEAIQFAQSAIRALDGCTVLINNAGVYMPGTIENEADGVFETQMGINLNSAYYLSQALIPTLKKTPRAHIFNMCSIASVQAYPNGSSYCISKFALLGLTKVLRAELLADGVGVTAIMPGATFTESWEGTKLPLSRFIKPDNIAEAVWTSWLMNENAIAEEIIIRPVAGDI